MTHRATLRIEDSAAELVLYMALELSNQKWKVGFSARGRERLVNVDAGNLAGLWEAVGQAKERLGLPATARVVSCYEAGRDGFWLHRCLIGAGVESVVIDPASVEVKRRARRAKTDRLDVRMLLDRLRRYWAGERHVWSVVAIPSEAAEDERRLDRERDRLRKERTAHRNRLVSLLVLHGVRLPLKADFEAALERVRLEDGRALGDRLKAELVREYARLRLVEAQLAAVMAELKARFGQDTPAAALMQRLLKLKGIGEIGATVMVTELFGWRQFANRKQVGALVGLTPTPFASGDMQREQGISKSGSRRLRALLIELAWGWLRHQPGSALSRWFHERFGGTGKRSRRVGIVALARKLLVALWRYLADGVLPEGAQLKAA